MISAHGLSRGARRMAFGVACAGVLVAVPLGPSAAADADASGADLTASTRVLEIATVALHQAEAALPQARAELVDAARRASGSRVRLAEVSAAVATGEAALRASEAAVAQTGSRLSSRQAELGELARVLYQQGGPDAQLSVVLSSESPGDLISRLQAVQRVTEHSAAVIARLKLERSSHQLALVQQAAQSVQLRNDRRSAAAEVVAAALLKARTTSAAAAASRAIAQRRATVAAALRARDEDAQLYAEAQTTAAALSARVRGGAALAGVAVVSMPGLLARPVIAPTTSRFGMRTNPVTGVYRLHSGVDFGSPCGTPITAAEAGQVIEAGWNSAYGYRTVLLHADIGDRSLVTAYSHQTRLGVRPGDSVARGQLIGWVGATGNATGCHLDFEVMLGGQFVNPASVL